MSNVATLIAIVAVFAITVAGVVGVRALTPQSDNAAIITGIMGTAGAILPAMILLLNRTASIETKATETSAKVEAVAAKVEAVHAATNGLTERLISATATASKAEGIMAERSRSDVAAAAVPATLPDSGGAAALTTVSGEPLVQTPPVPPGV